ncbi:ATP-binding protein [Caldanaerobius polysaccharolyticus]|uniref:ATP-binding protein n=1 Tax=Caldanaerobius polysaccharolyticus TaxID=44256 RepID=UPI00047E061F|nr:ATP-binding protein [Caldanaerobius polysaccharolyticus]
MSTKDLLKEVLDGASKLILYRGIVHRPGIREVIGIAKELLKENPSLGVIYSLYGDLYSILLNYAIENGAFQDLWRRVLTDAVAYDENAFSLISERYGFEAVGDSLAWEALQELKWLKTLSRLDVVGAVKEVVDVDLAHFEGCLKSYESSARGLKGAREDLIYLWDREDVQMVRYLSEYYRSNGCGIFGQYTAFRWVVEGCEGHLEGIRNVDPVTFDELIGYRDERQVVIDNTQAFLKGLPASNVLLYGDRGTGKSSTVKALLNEYSGQGLRMVEVRRGDMPFLHDIIDSVRNRGLKFILFFDDLSFDEMETNYKELKSILEGGVEALPPNAVVYATSNRRHLVKEYLQDNDSEELHSRDTKEEKLSLADRFGITVTFSTPDQRKYLDIVKGLAERFGLDVDWNVLREQAIKWAMWHNGMSPRSARQFIDHMRYKLAR